MFSPNTINVRPSLTISLLLSILFASLCTILHIANIPPLWLLPMVGAMALHWLYAIGQHGLLLWPNSVTNVKLTLDSNGEVVCKIRYKRGNWVPVSLDGDSLVTAPLTILSASPAIDQSTKPGIDSQESWLKILFGNLYKFRRQLIILTRDNCDQDTYRRLRVLLRMAPMSSTTS
ncbi:hypothetical protein BTA51_25000 [Hahella sp. CCB-MM4]|uniref:protein YgfX n=1 Tax=Hahella sp. (strain CCB-MM4) TaxID=1926491 RepID=UPI000B9B96CA|nr:protein YgfX [Hahella sp. CCB-MM4]OZG70627.1 hypothetical protein BTA51_25000 [Hahella sp. CCB-MM4]